MIQKCRAEYAIDCARAGDQRNVRGTLPSMCVVMSSVRTKFVACLRYALISASLPARRFLFRSVEQTHFETGSSIYGLVVRNLSIVSIT